MSYEDLFLIICIICAGLFSLNLSLLDSRDYWRKKWEKELERND